MAIKSSPAELFLFSTFNKEGLNWVPALIKSNRETRRDQIVIAKDPLNIATKAEMKAITERIKDVIAPNLKNAWFPSVVVFDFINPEQASWKSLARYAMNKITIGPNIDKGNIQPIWDFP